MEFTGLAYYAVPPAPGRPEGPSTAPASPVGASEQQAAPAAGGEGAPGGGGMGLALPLLLIVPFFLLMFWSSRNQQKKQRKLLEGLTKGDKILLQSGLAGKLVEMGDRYAKVEIAAGVRVDVLKTSVLGKDNAETAAAAQKQK